jgi:hypothetical protein
MEMEQWARVCRKILMEKQSKRSVMSEEGLHWETLQKVLAHSRPPGYGASRRANASPPPQMTLPSTPEARLQELDALKAQNLISDEEYAAKRKEILREV